MILFFFFETCWWRPNLNEWGYHFQTRWNFPVSVCNMICYRHLNLGFPCFANDHIPFTIYTPFLQTGLYSTSSLHQSPSVFLRVCIKFYGAAVGEPAWCGWRVVWLQWVVFLSNSTLHTFPNNWMNNLTCLYFESVITILLMWIIFRWDGNSRPQLWLECPSRALGKLWRGCRDTSTSAEGTACP